MPTNQPNGPRAIEPRVGAKTDRGKVREDNQDAMSGFRTPLGEVYIVADGMGGHEGGAIAAKMVVSGFEERLQHTAGQAPPEALCAAAAEINAEIHQRAYSGDPATEKMGSTAVLVLFAGPRMWVAHVGDSRAYLVRDRRLIRLTADHNRVQEMLARGILDEEAAKDHPDASVLSRAFGQKAEIKIDIAERRLQPGDGVLLCSDGLCGYAEDDEIERVILRTQMGGAQAVADALIKLALSKHKPDEGDGDNVTVQYLQFGEPTAHSTSVVPVGRQTQPEPGSVAATATHAAKPARFNFKSPLALTGLVVVLAFGFALGLILKDLWPWNTSQITGSHTPPTSPNPGQSPPPAQVAPLNIEAAERSAPSESESAAKSVTAVIDAVVGNQPVKLYVVVDGTGSVNDKPLADAVVDRLKQAVQQSAKDDTAADVLKGDFVKLAVQQVNADIYQQLHPQNALLPGPPPSPKKTSAPKASPSPKKTSTPKASPSPKKTSAPRPLPEQKKTQEKPVVPPARNNDEPSEILEAGFAKLSVYDPNAWLYGLPHSPVSGPSKKKRRAATPSPASLPGASLVIAWWHDHKIQIGYAGNARAYFFKEKDSERLTQENQRRLGQQPTLQLSLLPATREFKPGDSLMLCAAHPLDDEQLRALVANNRAQGAQAMVDVFIQTAQNLQTQTNKRGLAACFIRFKD